MDKALANRHLLSRAGFGYSIRDFEKYAPLDRKTTVRALMEDAQTYSPFTLVGKELMPPYLLPVKPSKEKAKALRERSKEKTKALNSAWINRMASGRGMLREKMTLFWHGHFACVTGNAYFAQLQNNTLRQHALGKFGDLLLAISKDPAMLLFLNNQQNRKRSPNENFARELLELFSIGRGNYDETDIKNAAKAFTGWSIGSGASYIFQEKQHDFGPKTFMGHTGNFNGEDIIHIVLKSPKTARFITEKIYRYFINEQTDPSRIDRLARYFYESDYDIGHLMEHIFLSDWFYSPEHIGSKIKSPIELTVGLLRNFGGNLNHPDGLLFLQRTLGQVLFSPPNVGGWPSGRAWIDSSSLTFRMVLPAVLTSKGKSGYQALREGNANAPKISKGVAEKLNMSIDWRGLQSLLSQPNKTLGADPFGHYFLGRKISPAQERLVTSYTSPYKEPNTIFRKRCVAYMSLPEYQLC